MSGSNQNERNLLTEIEILKMALADKQAENAINFRRKVELEESLLAWQEKFQRLYDSHKRVQSVNQSLEEKLLKSVDRNTRDRAKLTTNCGTLNIKLNKANSRILHLQNEIERYKKDISLAIHLLRCNPNGFVSPNLKSLPADVQSKLCPYLKNASASTFGGYQAVPSNDIFTPDELESYEKERDFALSPITVSKFLESELKKNVGIQTNAGKKIYPQFDVNSNLSPSIEQKPNEIFDQNFIHHKMCTLNAKSQQQQQQQQVVGTKNKEPKNLNPQQTSSENENGTKQFESFNRNLLSFVKNKKYTPRICALRINDEGIYLDDTHEIFIKKKSVLDIDDVFEKTESISPLNVVSSETTTTDDEIFSVNNKTDSEKFNEIKSHSKVDASHTTSENEVMKNQRIAEWIKSSVNASMPVEHNSNNSQRVETNSISSSKENFNNSLYNEDLRIQMEFNVKQFLLKQNEWNEMTSNCNNMKNILRTETGL